MKTEESKTGAGGTCPTCTKTAEQYRAFIVTGLAHAPMSDFTCPDPFHAPAGETAESVPVGAVGETFGLMQCAPGSPADVALRAVEMPEPGPAQDDVGSPKDGMRFWWHKFWTDHRDMAVAAPDDEDAWDFAEWFAEQCAESARPHQEKGGEELLDAAMIIRRLCNRLKKSARPGDHTIIFESLDWLKRKGLQGSILRSAPPVAEEEQKS